MSPVMEHDGAQVHVEGNMLGPIYDNCFRGISLTMEDLDRMGQYSIPKVAYVQRARPCTEHCSESATKMYPSMLSDHGLIYIL